MPSKSFAPQAAETTPEVGAAALTTGAPAADNSALLGQLQLPSLEDIGGMASDLWGWLWGTDTQQGGPTNDPSKTDPAKVPPSDNVPAITNAPGVTSATVRAVYANDPRAQAALDTLTADPGFAKLSADQQGGLLQRYQEAPNAATAQYLRGLAAYHSSDDKSGAGLAAYQNALKPDGGTFSTGGVNYTIQNGQLMGPDGTVAGDIQTDGTYQLTGQESRSNYYDDLHSRVNMTEGTGKDQKNLLTLHDADPNNKLTDAGMNDTFAGKATDTLKTLRREGMGMRVDSAYRSFTEQDGLYEKGRTKPGKKVTNARGGESWHNYGVAADIVFNDANGHSSWPEGGDYNKLWSRYGELTQAQGLEWGGSWTSIQDRPHMEYHPGKTASDASSLKNNVRRGGLESAWDAMGIGEQN